MSDRVYITSIEDARAIAENKDLCSDDCDPNVVAELVKALRELYDAVDEAVCIDYHLTGSIERAFDRCRLLDESDG